VLDTNIIVSGLLWGGVPGQVFLAAEQGIFTTLLTDTLLAETMLVLSRDKFVSVVQSRGIVLTQFRQKYAAASEIVEPAEIPPGAVRDPKDSMVLACAIGGQADFIVSGDKDLLNLLNYRYTPILTAAQFIERLYSG
jgi:putative PIN family toxin of toxin-antitoxin system